MKKLFFFVQCVISLAFGQTRPVGIFQEHGDIGNPKHSGDAQYDEAKQSYSLRGSGYNIWFNRDEFQYVYNKIGGDFMLTADFEFRGGKGNGHRKIGWSIRESTDEAGSGAYAVLHGDGLVVLQWREMKGAFMRDPQDEIFLAKKGAQTIQLERKGKTIIMRIAHKGEPLQLVGMHDMPDMPDSVVAGLFICSHDPEVSEEAKVWNVRIDKPIPNDYSPNPQIKLSTAKVLPGSRLETMDVFTGERKVIRESPGRFEAPNWMPDGKTLLYNESGHLFKIPVDGGQPEQLNTGAVADNNNDHGISFDGKMLAISSHRRELAGGGSTVYVLPLAGGEPRLLTANTPSYWHGWAPDGKSVLVVAQRNGVPVYNLYRVPLNGQAEIALTNNTEGHVDGPEYSPDGKSIYYNANPTGTMQIWKMNPDGSAKTQVTFDEYHNWFPHVSPDGKWIVFISFDTDIKPDDHPAYKKVILRMMPASGGAPRVIAYLYGGQGTLNAPSWSPDSKRISFVSNSQPAVK